MVDLLKKLAARWVWFLRPRSELLVFGSSILWGQGILPEEKIHMIFSRWLEKEKLERVKVRLFAHSGARVLGGGGNADLHGEIPRPEPSIIEQVKAAPAHRRRPIRILIEGGINELGGTTILNPRTPENEIRSGVEKACSRDLAIVMARVVAKYPSAEIFLFGYYHILSERVGGKDLKVLQKAESADGGATPRWDDYPELALRNSRIFVEESDRRLRKVAEETSASFGGSCRFVPSGFSETEGMFGRHSLLFHPWDSDPLMGTRARKCALAVARGQTGMHCFLASTAHPNEAGIQRYARQLIDAASETVK